MSSVDETQGDRNTAADTIAGLLAVGSIVLSAIAMGFGLLLQLHAHPARLAPVAIVAALVAARMSARYQSLAQGRALRRRRVGDRHGRRGRDRRPALSRAALTPSAARLAAPTTLLQHSEDGHPTDGDGANVGLTWASAARGLPRRPRERPTRVAPDLRGVGDTVARRGGGQAVRQRPPPATAGHRHPHRPPEVAPTPADADASDPRHCSAASPRRWRSSRRTACTGTSRRGSTRSAPSLGRPGPRAESGSCRR